MWLHCSKTGQKVNYKIDIETSEVFLKCLTFNHFIQTFSFSHTYILTSTVINLIYFISANK